MARAYLGLGSNVGRRREHLRFALHELSKHGQLLARSPLIETEPVDCPAGGKFLNACVCLETPLDAKGLLAVAMEIESARGRKRRIRNQPRPLDIDLLLIDDQSFDAKGLTVPHPRMHERQFVLEPLAAIAPERIHPSLSVTVRELLETLESPVSKGGFVRTAPSRPRGRDSNTVRP